MARKRAGKVRIALSMRRTPLILASILCLAFILGACSPTPSKQLRVFAASSLTQAFEELGAEFERGHAGLQVRLNFAGSATLATQLIEGAPADLFASADEAQMRALQAAGLVAEEAQEFAGNRLVLIVPADNPANIQAIDDLALPGIRLLLAAPGVPIREYSDELIAKLGDAEFQQAVYANLVSEEENVRVVLSKVALGEADAGIVYASDLLGEQSDKILSIEIPEEAQVRASYPIAPLAESSQAELAAEFVAFVLSARGQAILAQWGFSPAR